MKEFTGTTHQDINSIAVIGNYPPRKCGIATFTADLVESLSDLEYRCRALAINDISGGYEYPENVRFEINQDALQDYYTAATFLNTSEVDILSLQHEFGIFGGPSGGHILSLLSNLEIPVVTTLHTILTDPSDKQQQIMSRLSTLSRRFIVMSKKAVNILHTAYDIPREKINYIPHGIPDVPFVDPNYYKEQFGLLGKKVLLTFGLLSGNKGIEYVIKGLPDVVERFPNLTYIVLGATHPQVIEHEGEKYRRRLEKLVSDLGLDDHVIFEDRFVPFEELRTYLAATDIYITPYVNEQQITSGTLAYAAGTGKAIISTPYWHAEEMLGQGRGRLVPFRDEKAMAEAMLELFEDDTLRHRMRKQAYDFNRDATWPKVARQYISVFKSVKSGHQQIPRLLNGAQKTQKQPEDARLELPRLRINHLSALTDGTGMLQHATYSVANRDHGYCTEDNARALIASVRAAQLSAIPEADNIRLRSLTGTYLSFLLHAFNEETGRFRNQMSYARAWENENLGSADAHGRALWGLGITVSGAKKNSHLSLAASLFLGALPAVESFDSPRAMAFSMLGIDAYLDTFAGDSKARRIYAALADRLFSLFAKHKQDQWPWIEDTLAYSNGTLCHALIAAGTTLRRDELTETGIESLGWLIEIQTERARFTPIGNQGWYPRGGGKARFDQQPLEAQGLLQACVAAYKVSGSEEWLQSARCCFNWFRGENDLNTPLNDRQTGGCRDGLHVDSVNRNQGAESTLTWLLSLIEMLQLTEYDGFDLEKTPSARAEAFKLDQPEGLAPPRAWPATHEDSRL